jgi:anti-sigma B factor antagonist
MPSESRSSFTASVDGDSATIAVRGEFDMAGTFTIEPALEETLRERGLRHMTLDLSGLSFIDSSGMGVIVKLDADSRARGITLAIVPGPDHVQRVFDATGLTETLPFRRG